MSSHRHIDEVSGVETTGHVWDGDLRELNKPLPRWWVWVFLVCIVWSIGYFIVYPAWPLATDYTKGIWNYSQRGQVAADVAAAKAAQSKYLTAIAQTSEADIAKNPELQQFAMTGGAALFANNCAPCHGSGAQGAVGYPNLRDDDWLWGGTTAQIHDTIAYGIRSGHAKGRDSAMPKFGLDGVLDDTKISDTANYVRSLSGLEADAAAAGRGAAIFAENCAVCHGADGKGNPELGAPNLVDKIWLYGNSQADVMQSIRTGRGGVMPAWTEKLDPQSIKMLTIYVHSLGGGK